MRQGNHTAPNLTRRNFLARTTAGVMAGSSAGYFVGASASAAESTSPNEKLNMAIIGVGGRGGANMMGVARENIYGLCDVWQDPLDRAKKRFPGAKVFHDWRDVLEDDQVDAVVISTADHHHAVASIAAMRAGKHVYCEKPLAHTVTEARRMQDEYIARKDKIATQMGTQIHAGGNYRRVVELVQAGAVGPVREAHVWCNRGIRAVGQAVLPEQPVPDGFHWDVWLGPAATRPYNEGYWKGGNLNWNRRWDFGNGVLGDMGSHLIDLPFWALKLHRPLTVESEGPEADPVACPPWQQVTWEHPAQADNPAVAAGLKVVWYHGGEGMKRRAALLQPMVGKDTEINKWPIGVAFIGERGILVADYGKYVLSPSAKFKDFTAPAQSIPPSPGHYAEWIRACKGGEPSLCTFDYSGALIEHNLLGNVAHRVGKKLQWDPKKLQATSWCALPRGCPNRAETGSPPDVLPSRNAPEASQYLTKDYRKGWAI